MNKIGWLHGDENKFATMLVSMSRYEYDEIAKLLGNRDMEAEEDRLDQWRAGFIKHLNMLEIPDTIVHIVSAALRHDPDKFLDEAGKRLGFYSWAERMVLHFDEKRAVGHKSGIGDIEGIGFVHYPALMEALLRLRRPERFTQP